jgi:hypothetical protein
VPVTDLRMQHDKYVLKVTSNGFRTCESAQLETRFNKAGIYKIYIFKRGKSIIYVGLTRQKLLTRLAGSFGAYRRRIQTKESTNGYCGYKMISHFKNKGLLKVLVFPLTHLRNGDKSDYEKAEAIEAEVVFAIRAKTGKWPLFQNEIHFYNFKTSKRYANSIFSELKI